MRQLVYSAKRRVFMVWIAFLTYYPFCIVTFVRNVTFYKVLVTKDKAWVLIL